MAMFKPVREGSWFLHSETDPKWNKQGSGFVGGFVMPEEVSLAIERLEKLYGDQPEDLEWGYMKD